MLLYTYLLTCSLGSSEAGEFAANLYLSTAPGQGSLSIYPVQQNDPNLTLTLGLILTLTPTLTLNPFLTPTLSLSLTLTLSP